MKTLGIIVAAIAGLVAAAPASAYRTPTPVAASVAADLLPAAQVVDRDDRRHWDRGRGWDRRDRGRRWDRRDWNRGRHRGWSNQWRWRSSCHNQWRDGRRERVCRRIRYR